jgi:hypothetical protein
MWLDLGFLWMPREPRFVGALSAVNAAKKLTEPASLAGARPLRVDG